MKVFSGVLFAAAVIAADVCNEKVDRDVKIAIGFDATSNCYWTRYSLAGIADGLKEIDAWVSESGHQLLVSKLRLGDGRETMYKCLEGWEANKKVADIASNIAGMTNVNYLSGKAPLLMLPWILTRMSWKQDRLRSERRIVVIATSHWPTVGNTEWPVEMPSPLQGLCPATDKQGTAQQVKDSIRGYGLGMFPWVWRQYISTVAQATDGWKSLFDKLEINDYYMLGFGWSNELDNAAKHFVKGARTLICPSWIATTTTYAPYAPSREVEACISCVGLENGKSLNEDGFKKLLSDCVFNHVGECVSH